jgi:hypothetical protein
MIEDDDLLAEADNDASLRAIADCLRRALLDVEAALASDDTPLTKVDRVGAALETLGDRLDNLADWLPAQR